MTFLLNEKSVHGQFPTVADFHSAVDTVMRIRAAIRKAGHEIRCDRSLTHALVTSSLVMAQAIQTMSKDKQRAWTQWISRSGPFWMDDREHGQDDWMLMSDESDVTNTSIGEAAFCTANGVQRQLVSFTPSDWCDNPLTVTWLGDTETRMSIDVQNHVAIDSIFASLEKLPVLFSDWPSLEDFSRRSCDHILFTDDAFESLRPHPYHQGVAERLSILLNVLNRVSGGFDKNGKRTAECQALLSEHFSGGKAWFTDSSPSEKHEFESKLTFRHPTDPTKRVSCTWHGKVKTPQMRIHFSWPITANTKIYVPYVGPKITIR